ncbi:hypothetical protein [Roseibium polysiphoniae]|uniref:Uncharacterized protein n=1 Tax=Roseibium polysiphoniae TaxID=2571221 RepID=A0ABR9CCP3_9HYPH|nr:hypothetical protein [Roseibium polysiphoniae]MBD8877675.1 hypothetical protein [Roseibium polysiphoniae]
MNISLKVRWVPAIPVMTVFVSTGLPVPADIQALLVEHRRLATADRRGRDVLERQQGAYTSTIEMAGHEVCVREEFGFRGHVIYIMTVRERVSDTVEEWLEFEWGEPDED